MYVQTLTNHIIIREEGFKSATKYTMTKFQSVKINCQASFVHGQRQKIPCTILGCFLHFWQMKLLVRTAALLNIILVSSDQVDTLFVEVVKQYACTIRK
jgi:hypothetical protein